MALSFSRSARVWLRVRRDAVKHGAAHVTASRSYALDFFQRMAQPERAEPLPDPVHSCDPDRDVVSPLTRLDDWIAGGGFSYDHLEALFRTRYNFPTDGEDSHLGDVVFEKLRRANQCPTSLLHFAQYAPKSLAGKQVLHNLLTDYARVGNWKGACGVFDLMATDSTNPPDTATRNLLLECLANSSPQDSGWRTDPLDVFGALLEAKCKPNVRTLHWTVRALLLRGHLAPARNLLNEFQKNWKIDPPLPTLNAILQSPELSSAHALAIVSRLVNLAENSEQPGPGLLCLTHMFHRFEAEIDSNDFTPRDNRPLLQAIHIFLHCQASAPGSHVPTEDSARNALAGRLLEAFIGTPPHGINESQPRTLALLSEFAHFNVADNVPILVGHPTEPYPYEVDHNALKHFVKQADTLPKIWGLLERRWREMGPRELSALAYKAAKIVAENPDEVDQCPVDVTALLKLNFDHISSYRAKHSLNLLRALRTFWPLGFISERSAYIWFDTALKRLAKDFGSYGLRANSSHDRAILSVPEILDLMETIVSMRLIDVDLLEQLSQQIKFQTADLKEQRVWSKMLTSTQNKQCLRPAQLVAIGEGYSALNFHHKELLDLFALQFIKGNNRRLACDFDEDQLSKLAVVFANQGYCGSHEVWSAINHQIARRLHDNCFSLEQLVDLSWSMVTLGYFPEYMLLYPTFERINKKFSDGVPLETVISPAHQAKLFEIVSILNAAPRERLNLPNVPGPDLVHSLKQAFHSVLAKEHASVCQLQKRDHLRVVEILRERGITARAGACTPEGLLVDVFLPKQGVAVEFDSALRNAVVAGLDPVKTRGRREKTRELLERAGYKVVVLRSNVAGRVGGNRARSVVYTLREKLAEVGVELPDQEDTQGAAATAGPRWREPETTDSEDSVGAILRTTGAQLA